METPAELPAELADELRFDSGTFFHNSVTQEASWEDPAELSWRAIQANGGKVFWFHPQVRVSGPIPANKAAAIPLHTPMVSVAEPHAVLLATMRSLWSLANALLEHCTLY